MLTKETLFRPTKSESKAESTTRVVKEMIDAQTSEREIKTRRLRSARLERDAAEKAQIASEPPAPKAKRRKKSPLDN